MPGSSGHFVFAYGGLPAGRGANVGKGRSFSRAVVPLCLRLWSPGGPSHFVGPFPFREPTPPGATATRHKIRHHNTKQPRHTQSLSQCLRLWRSRLTVVKHRRPAASQHRRASLHLPLLERPRVSAAIRQQQQLGPAIHGTRVLSSFTNAYVRSGDNRREESLWRAPRSGEL